MEGILICVVKDSNAKYRRPGEKVTIQSQVTRSSFDSRTLFRVVFADEAFASIFSTEFEPVEEQALEA